MLLIYNNHHGNYLYMNCIALIEEKPIFAREAQRIVALKLAYNKLANKYNRELAVMDEQEKQETIASLAELNHKITLSL